MKTSLYATEPRDVTNDKPTSRIHIRKYDRVEWRNIWQQRGMYLKEEMILSKAIHLSILRRLDYEIVSGPNMWRARAYRMLHKVD